MKRIVKARTVLALAALVIVPAPLEAATVSICLGNPTPIDLTETRAPFEAAAPMQKMAPPQANTARDPLDVLVSRALLDHAAQGRMSHFEPPPMRSGTKGEPRRDTFWARLVADVASFLPRRVPRGDSGTAPESVAAVGLPPALPLFLGGLVFVAILGRRRSRR